MANILEILNTISNAQYGRDVRQAIVDGISQCYADGKAGVNDLQARQLIESAIAVNEDQQAELMNLLARIEEIESGSEEGTSESTTIEVPSLIIDSGIVENITIENSGTSTKTVTFSKEFTEIPTVSCALMVQNTAVASYSIVNVVVIKSSISTTGFRFTVANRSGSQRSAVVGWFAIQPTTKTIPIDVTIPDADGMSEADVREITNPIQTSLDGVKTGYDGTVYNTPGEAVRTQINGLNIRLDEQEEIVERLNEGGLDIKDDFIKTQITEWLNDHPEATTTVQDGAISEVKLASALKPKIMNTYVIPEMYGAVGDGVTDDTNAIQSMFNAATSGEKICFSKSYYFNRVIIEKDGLNITGGNINGIFVLNANNLTFNNCTFSKELEIQWARGCVISKCLFNGEVGILVPATKTVTEHENPNAYGDPWFHAVGRLNVSHCTFDIGTSSVRVYFDNTQQYGWMRSNDWIFSNNICRGVNTPSAEHDFYIQGIDGIRICENTFFTADNAVNYQCPIVEIGRCDWLQIIGNNFFPATKEFIKLTNPRNVIVSNNHFAWQRYTNNVINSHPAIDISCTVDGQSLIVTNNTAYQITSNFVNLAKTGNLIIWGEISGNSCYFRDKTGGVTSGNNYIAYSNESFPRVNVHDNAVFGNLYNSDGDESHNVGKTETNVTLVSTNCTLGASTFCTYDDESVVFSAEITPSEEISAYTVLVTGFPTPKSGYYYMTIADTAGATFPAFIDRNGLKLRLKSGTRALFVSGFYKR